MTLGTPNKPFPMYALVLACLCLLSVFASNAELDKGRARGCGVGDAECAKRQVMEEMLAYLDALRSPEGALIINDFFITQACISTWAELCTTAPGCCVLTSTPSQWWAMVSPNNLTFEIEEIKVHEDYVTVKGTAIFGVADPVYRSYVLQSTFVWVPEGKCKWKISRMTALSQVCEVTNVLCSKCGFTLPPL